jgi:hypothetical protein
VIDWLFRDRETGRIVIAQVPNLPLGIFLVARIADRVLDPSTSALRWIGTAALLWWAGDELVRGVNPWRRILGAVVATATIVGVVW